MANVFLTAAHTGALFGHKGASTYGTPRVGGKVVKAEVGHARFAQAVPTFVHTKQQSAAKGAVARKEALLNERTQVG
jgi:hypothetical protein